jgi:hypothetical protein
MAALGENGNNKMIPIAYAVVEAETRDSWQWFLNLLLEDLIRPSYQTNKRVWKLQFIILVSV